MHTKNDSGAMPPASDWTDPDDAPELTEAFFADAEFYKGDTFVRRGPGRPATGKAKELVSLRLDRDVLAKLREGGPGWQTRVNELLRKMLIGPVEPTVIVSDTLKLQPVDRVVYASTSLGEFVRLHEERVLVEREPVERLGAPPLALSSASASPLAGAPQGASRQAKPTGPDRGREEGRAGHRGGGEERAKGQETPGMKEGT